MTKLLASGGEFVAPGVKDFFLPPIFGAVTKPMVLLVLSILIIGVFFIAATRNMKLIPGKFQFAAESVYDFGRNNIAREQIGAKDFKPFIPLILTIFTFVLVNNLFGLIPIIQFPTMSHIGFPIFGDVLYGNAGEAPLQLLATHLVFIDPVSGCERQLQTRRKLESVMRRFPFSERSTSGKASGE